MSSYAFIDALVVPEVTDTITVTVTAEAMARTIFVASSYEASLALTTILPEIADVVLRASVQFEVNNPRVGTQPDPRSSDIMPIPGLCYDGYVISGEQVTKFQNLKRKLTNNPIKGLDIKEPALPTKISRG